MINTRDNCFDFLRFLFAFIVVIGHLIVLTDIVVYQPFLPAFNTYISITGFFIISGFLITQSCVNSRSLSSYFIKRAKRLLPAYYLVVIGCAIGLVFLSTYSPQEYFTHPLWRKYLAANLTFLNFIQPCLPGVFENNPLECGVDGALWTLKIEVAFYLCVPLIVWGLRKMRKPWIMLLCIYILSVLYRNGLHVLADYSGKHVYAVLARQLPGFLSYFSVGIGLYWYKEWFLKYKNKLILPALLLVIFEHYMDFEWLLPAAFGVVVIWCAYSLPALNNFARFGDISYGIYIYHFPLIQMLIAVGFFEKLNVWVAAFIVVCSVIALGLLSWHGMEKHILKR